MLFVHDMSWVARDKREMMFTVFSTILESTELVNAIYGENSQTVTVYSMYVS